MASIPGIPSLPTDNLYKFMALSGVALIIVPIIIIATLSNSANQQLILLEGRNSYIETIFKIFEESDESVTPISRFDDISDRGWEVLKLRAEAAKNFSEIEEMLADTISNIKWLIFVILVGTFLASWGFFLWYRKVQRHQDAILLMTKDEAILRVTQLLEKSEQAEEALPTKKTTSRRRRSKGTNKSAKPDVDSKGNG